MRMVKGLLLAGVVALAPGCSGKKDAEEPVASDAKGEKSEAPAEAATAEAATPPPAAAEAPAAPAPAPAPAAAHAAPAPAAPVEPEGFAGAKATRYVRVVAIKVHALPDKLSPVLGWVKKGDAVEVVVNGDWAKLGPGRYISNKFLSEQPVAPVTPGAKAAK
jgi:pyruvate/2-oxoglutarate dehydrogenase complex dihydrolipoamide acyltransferase (E2) component